MTQSHILSNYKVLDMSQFLAGPTTSRLMAELGAEVIKVEIAPYGDRARAFPFRKGGRSGYFVQHNRGKKSVCVNIKEPRAKEILVGLIEKCDVLLQNFAPGVMERMGFGWEEVQKINPKIVMCSISAFGQTGPLSNRPGFDYIAQAYAGVTDVMGEADGPPSLAQVAMGDIGTGVHATGAIAFALLDRTRTGKGQHLDISLLDSYFHYHDMNVETYSADQRNGGELGFVPTRGGSHHHTGCPTGIFQSKENFVLICTAVHQWKYLCKVIGREDLIKKPGWRTMAERRANLDEVVKLIEDWMQEQDSDDEVIRKMEEGRVPIAPVMSVPEAMAHPHLIERGTVRTISDPVLGEFQIPGMPLRFSAYPDLLDLVSPGLGEQNAQVLSETLSYSADQIKTLEEDGVLVSRMRKKQAGE